MIPGWGQLKGRGLLSLLSSLDFLVVNPQKSLLPHHHPPIHYSSSSRALGIPATECEFVGSLPVIVVGRLKVALEPQLWELRKVLRKAG